MIGAFDVASAARALEGRIVHTPLLFSDFFSRERGAHVYLKLESLQRTGSFKVRGATYKILRTLGRIGPKGVVAASAGNHAQGVALAASNLGVRATVVMPESASLSKQLATRAYGAEVVLRGANIAESLRHARELADRGHTFVHPFDDDDVMAGQGTLGLEILADLPDVDEVWLPVGGGGLAAGVAAAVKATRPGCRLVGVQAGACPSARRALEAGSPSDVEAAPTIADGIAVPRLGDRPFEVLREHLGEVFEVGEDQLAAAMVHLLERKKVLAEGAGAAALAALLAAPSERVRGRRIALVISGGNVDLNVLDRVVERGLLHAGRVLRFGAVLPDVPGALAAVLAVVAREGANVLHVAHDRLRPGVPLGSTRVDVWAETRGFPHCRRIAEALGEAGVRVDDGEG